MSVQKIYTHAFVTHFKLSNTPRLSFMIAEHANMN